MMEYGDRGIKGADDVIACIEEDGATAMELYELHGERIAPMIAEALDLLRARWVSQR